MFKTENLYQNDPKWKDKPLGKSSETIGSWGCLLTSVTMMLNGMGYNETPDSVNDKMKAAGGFQEAFFIPSVIPYVFPNVSYKGTQPCESSPAPVSTIDAAVAAGKPVILEVDWSKQAGLQTHFVLVKEKQGDDYVLYDPYMYPGDSPDKDVLLTKRYKYNGATLAKEISGVLWFDGYIPPSPPDPMELPIPADNFKLYVIEDDLALRADPSVSGYLWGRMAFGTELVSLETKAVTMTKVGKQDQWVKVQDPKGTQGYTAAWYVSDKKETQPADSTATTAASGSTTTASSTTPAAVPAGALLLVPTDDVAFRAQPVISDSTLIRRIPVTEQLICLEPPSQAAPKVGAVNQWLNVRDSSGKDGYVAAWYVKYASGSTAQAQTQTATPSESDSGPVKIKASAEGLAFRKQPVVNDATLIARVSIGTEFTLSDPADKSKIGQTNQWLKVKDASGTEGYVAAWFVTL